MTELGETYLTAAARRIEEIVLPVEGPQDPRMMLGYAVLAHTTGVDTTLRHVHDMWCAMMVLDGWTYAPVKDREARRTPYLVPFAELPEAIAGYDVIFRDAIITAAAEV